MTSAPNWPSICIAQRLSGSAWKLVRLIPPAFTRVSANDHEA